MEASIFVTVGSMLIFLINVIWIRTKFILSKKGYQISWLSQHLRDYTNLNKAIELEKDTLELNKLKLQKKLMLSTWVIFPLGAALIFTFAGK